MHFQIPIPSQIDVTIQNQTMVFKGPLGSQTVQCQALDPKGFFLFRLSRPVIEIKSKQSSSKKLKAYRGSIQSSFQKIFQGLLQGYLFQLELIGVGFRVEQTNQKLELKLGYSHPITYELPSDVRAIISKSTHIALYGIDQTRVSQIGAEIKHLRLPEAYQGKGIRFNTDNIILKVKK